MAAPHPITQAIRVLRAAGIPFEPHLYDYEEKGGTRRSSEELGVPEHQVVKTLVMEDEHRKALIILMHGDREVSTKNLARQLQVKAIKPCDPKTAEKHTGYLVGGTSPFGTRTALPVYAERSIFALDKIYINGGKRGFLVAIAPSALKSVLSVTEVDAAV